MTIHDKILSLGKRKENIKVKKQESVVCLSKVAGEEVRKLTKAKSSMALWVMVRILGFIIVLSCPLDTFYYVRT